MSEFESWLKNRIKYLFFALATTMGIYVAYLIYKKVKGGR